VKSNEGAALTAPPVPSQAEIAEARRRVKWLTEATDATAHLAYDDDDAMLRLIATALDSIYEVWATARKLNEIRTGSKHLTDTTLTTSDEQTTAALVCARGFRTHQLASFGQTFAFGEGPFGAGPYGGGWHWQPIPAGTDYRHRRAWYAQYVEYRTITPVLRVAEQFLAGEIARLS
jgi:hypothetical protein